MASFKVTPSTCPKCLGRSTKRYLAAHGVCSSCNKASTKPHIKKELRDQVWNTYAFADDNKDEAHCFVCEDELLKKNFVCAHVVAHSKGGLSTIENLRPTCSHCNLSMGTMNLMDFKANFKRIIDVTARMEILRSELDSLGKEMQHLRVSAENSPDSGSKNN